MKPFDGPFADTYVLPLAIAAYSSSPPTNFAKTWEIVASDPSTTALNGLAMLSPADDSNSKAFDAYRAMLMHPADTPPGEPSNLSLTQAGTLAAPASNLHFGWVCADTKTNILTIAIRGTQYFKEWLEDFDFLAVPYQPIAGKGLVHQGFQIVYYSIRDQIATIVKEARTQFPSLTTLLITGHSLGAAVVGLAAPDILLGPASGLDPLVYPFAEPRVGHADYKDFYDATVPVCYRIDNIWDIVPHAPPLLALYVHEGQEVIINSGFSFSIAHNHELATGYVPGLAKWVADHTTATIAAFATSLQNPTLVGVSP